MKKLVSFIPITVMFAILAVLFIFMCLPQNQSRVTAVNGVLDLRGETEIAPLVGEWEFIYGELLTPDEFAAIRDSQAETINVPSSWSDYGYDLGGCATYRLTVLTDRQEPLTLFLPEIHTAYVLYVNGEIARTAGVVSADRGEARLFYENALVPIIAENDAIELVFQVSNYYESESGLTGNLLLGESEQIQSWYFQTRVLAAIAIGSFLMAAFYHLTLFIYRRREKIYLLFAALCFLCFMRFFMETNSLNAYFQFIPENIYGIKFYLALTFAHVNVVSGFMLCLFNMEFVRKYRFPLIGYFTFHFLVGMFTPTNMVLYSLIILIISLPYYIVSITVAVRSASIKESGVMKLCFVALLVYLIIGMGAKIFLDNTLFMTGLLTNMFMIMVQSMVLSQRYTDAFRFVEETNLNLEQIVDERTKSLTEANAAILAANSAMKELIANISHDLKTPLSVLSLNLESLSELAATQSDSDYQRFVRGAYQKNLDLQRLIQNLFEVSRIETGRQAYSPEWVSVHKLLAQAEEKYDIFLEDVGLSFDVVLEDNAEIWADPQKIWNVFDNIIYNAVRYTEKGGRIAITAHNDEDAVTITIEDTGCGIADEHLPRVFERFYRASQARSEHEGESGLGLYIVKSIMEGCGGSVGIESEIGKGTRIILSFPKKLLPNP